MKRKIFLSLMLALAADSLPAQETPNFSILFHGGGSVCDGFLGTGGTAPEGGLWMGISVSDRFDGLWGMDYYTLPSQSVTLFQPSRSNPVSFFVVQPSDDFALTVNTRYYVGDKYDSVHGRFNSVPYLLAGLGMDIVIDQPAPPPTDGLQPPTTGFFYNKSYDVLFSLNLGLGMDFPLDRQWFFYTEGLDHLIAWQGLTQIVSVRAGFKVMLDSAHVDPFR